MPVSFIPSQLDAPSVAAALTLRDSPSRLLFKDIRLAFRNSHYLPYLFFPLRIKSGPYDEITPTRRNSKDVALHLAIFSLTIGSFGVGARIAYCTSASWVALYAAGCWAGLMALAHPLNYGPRILQSKVNLDRYPEHPEEKWIFVNGICAGTRYLQENLDMISNIFKRPVTGVHNRSYGIIFDLLECLVQRDFSYMTADIRVVYNEIKIALMNESIEKVVLLAHSQGGIIISTALDALYADLPPAAWDKLEIYTFGNAANHFNNPPRCIQCHNGSCNPLPGLPSHPPSNRRQIAVIEHYANSKDFVARLGVLQSVKGLPGGNQFVGKVFTRLGEGGHLFCQHYLGPMFNGIRPDFLDEVVVPEEDTAIRRAEAGAKNGRDEIEKVSEAEDQIGDAVGQTVMEISRLWKYKDGRIPEPALPPSLRRFNSTSSKGSMESDASTVLVD
ncbi:hypothetical protein FPQ18DRAFT_254108 [Pyronema domesticum]|nr:hypothetical protein FPQ18DRAFT_254108 [Pyronema domesticum]